MKFSKKTAHRLIIALSMLAPVLYLFGTMFSYLWGAHGSLAVADEEPIVLEYEEKYFCQYFDGEVSQDERFLYPENNGDLDVGHVYYASAYVEASANFGASGSIACGFRDGTRWFYILSGGYTGSQTFATFYDTTFTALNGNFWLGIYFVDASNTSYTYRNVQLFDLTLMYGAGNEPTAQDFRVDYPEVYYPLDMGSLRLEPVYGVPSKSEFFFSQFFPRNNFLERVGVNALSSAPIGFSPFGAFLSYLDQNMLHASESQMALMIYGEVYWALHIVLADLVYHVAVFFPNLIERVFDWFGQKGLNDD